MAKAMTPREQEMRELIAQQQSSGLTQQAFATSIGMNFGTFAWWKREIGRRARRRDQPAAEPRAPTFLPVEVTQPQSPPHRAAACALAVHVADLRIEVPRDFDDDHLRRVLAAVRTC